MSKRYLDVDEMQSEFNSGNRDWSSIINKAMTSDESMIQNVKIQSDLIKKLSNENSELRRQNNSLLEKIKELKEEIKNFEAISMLNKKS